MSYYAEKLSAQRLRKCYDIAPPRVRQDLDAEVAHVAGRIRPGDTVLELGCGYGRIFEKLTDRSTTLIGIDTALSSLQLGREMFGGFGNVHFLQMDAANLAFCDGAFDVVLCIQNGLSAFKVNQRDLIGESVRVTRPGGRVLLSTYAEKFWEHRLRWFKLQADHGLLGEIDQRATGNGVIVCRDGFKATTITPDNFQALTNELAQRTHLLEVDKSSLFCEISV
ncbi:MAG: class I SAM-dependent methyltransferase [Phycisphaerales bacterium]|nr:MAG: class I SAM-dependent methyltransferase [Phycisphaerales bacterium]